MNISIVKFKKSGDYLCYSCPADAEVKILGIIGWNIIISIELRKYRLNSKCYKEVYVKVFDPKLKPVTLLNEIAIGT